MAMKLTDRDVLTIAQSVLGRELAGIGFEAVEAYSDYDQGGDPAIFVRLAMRADAPIIPGDRLAHAHVALLDDLEGRGEERFAYLNIDWPSDEAPHNPDVAA